MPAQEDEPMPMQASSTPGSQAQAAVSGWCSGLLMGPPARLPRRRVQRAGQQVEQKRAASLTGPSSPTITGVGLALVDVSSSEKHAKVLAHFRSGIGLPAWVAVVDTWCTLEVATGLLVPGKVLPPHGRPEAIPASLEEDDQWDAFYDKVVKWWIAVNPAWQKEGVTGPASFAEHGLKQESGGDLGGCWWG
ncbi:hypothetical protein B0H14DRAFT_3512714 [Mycena olivaceomarginata]|nr:hypothetical protein B0H14DRAFT_3512714 [Mycena olivaceomarginata]